MLRSLFLLPLTLLTLCCPAQDAPIRKAPAWATWKGEGVSLAHPVAWVAHASGANGTVVAFVSPMDSGDVFRENVSLRVEASDGKDLTSFVGATEQWIANDLPKGVLIHSGATRDGTGELHQLEYTGEIAERPVHGKQVVRLRGGKAYRLTFVADRDAWDEMLYIAEAIMGSFKWAE